MTNVLFSIGLFEPGFIFFWILHSSTRHTRFSSGWHQCNIRSVLQPVTKIDTKTLGNCYITDYWNFEIKASSKFSGKIHPLKPGVAFLYPLKTSVCFYTIKEAAFLSCITCVLPTLQVPDVRSTARNSNENEYVLHFKNVIALTMTPPCLLLLLNSKGLQWKWVANI